jgi:hypothetical protein
VCPVLLDTSVHFCHASLPALQKVTPNADGDVDIGCGGAFGGKNEEDEEAAAAAGGDPDGVLPFSVCWLCVF